MSNTMMQPILPDWKMLFGGAQNTAVRGGSVSFGFGAVCTLAHTTAPYIADVQGISVPKGRRRRT